MKKVTIFLVVLLCITGSVGAQTMYDVRVGNALNGKMPFELRRAYEAGKDSLNPMLKCFAESLLANYFNRPQAACSAIDSLISKHQGEIGMGNVLSMIYVKAVNLCKLGRYDEAAQMLDGVLQTMAPHLGDSTLAPFYEKADECRELAKVGNINSVSIPRQGARMPFRIDSVGAEGKKGETIMVGALINGMSQDFVFDTGAGVNVASEKAAERLGLRMLDAGSRAKGIGIQHGRKAIADEIRIGDLTLRNVPFLVMTISSGVDSIDAYMKHLDIIMGVELMYAVKEVQINFTDKELFVPYTPSAIGEGEEPNLAGNGEGTFCTEADLDGTTASVVLDTGAGFSVLGSRYFAMHKERIEVECEPDTVRQAGAGGVNIGKAYKLKNFTISIGGGSYTFPEIPVGTAEGGLESNKFANIGMDYFRQFGKVVFNIKDMFVRMLEKKFIE